MEISSSFLRLVVEVLCCCVVCGEFQDVFFFKAELVFKHRRPAAFFLNTPDHIITRDPLPFGEFLKMPGIPELLVADSHCIGETITIKQTYDEAVGCRHLEWLPVLVTVSHVCPSLPGTGQRRKRLLNIIVRGIGVCNFNACTTFTLLAFNGFDWPSTATDELVSGKFTTCRRQARSSAHNPDWSKVFSIGSVCLALLLAEEASEGCDSKWSAAVD